MKNWSNKNILITGGTSGLGRGLAIRLAEKGARVAVVARSSGGLQELAGRYSIQPIQADIGRKQDIHRIAAEAAGQLGPIDMLVNNASSLGETPLPLLLDTACETLETVLQTNLLGPFRLIKALLPGMLLKQQGLILNISSDAAVSAYPAWGAYGTSKAALDHLTRIWAAELAGQGLHLLAVDPGDMDTPLHHAAIPGADPTSLYPPGQVADQLLQFLAQPPFSQVRYDAGEWRRSLKGGQ